MRGHGTLHFLV